MVPERKDSLWALIAGPVVWSAYFLVVYITAAIRCAKAESALTEIVDIRILIAALGLVSVTAIGFAGMRAWRRWRSGGGTLPPHGDDTDQSRHEFMALATLLLCGVSFVATVYVALPALFFTDCR